MELTDDYFIAKLASEEQTATPKSSDLSSISNLDDWATQRLAEKVELPEDSKFKFGDRVVFNHHQMRYTGSVAGKNNEGYLVQTQPGETYVVPEQFLIATKANASDIRKAMANGRIVNLTKLAEHQVSPSRFVYDVQFRERRPTDSELLLWADTNVKNARLVDVDGRGDRVLSLIFEKEATAEDCTMCRGMGEVKGHGPASCPSCRGTGKKPSQKDLDEEAKYHEPKKKADADVKPQGGDTMERSRGLSSEEMEGTGPMAVSPLVQQTDKTADVAADLEEAARWILGRFNAANPGYSAVPGHTEMSEGGNVLKLSFELNKRDEDDKLDRVYMDRTGALNTSAGTPVSGFVQVDAAADLPMVMLAGTNGPVNVQEYGFHMAASKDIVLDTANSILDKHNGCTAEAEMEFTASLDKMAVDKATKDYWTKYFGSYGKQWTRNIPRSLNNRKESAQKFAKIVKEKGKYCVKSEHNPDWNGGCYDTEEEAKHRLQQVEMFKHMKGGSAKTAMDIRSLAEWAIAQAATDASVADTISASLLDWLQRHPKQVMAFSEMDKTDALAVAMTESRQTLDRVMRLLRGSMHSQRKDLKQQQPKSKSDMEANKVAQRIPEDLIEEARAWCMDVFEPGSEESIEHASPGELTDAIDRYYDGGVPAFLEAMGHGAFEMTGATKQAAPVNRPMAYNTPSKDDRKDYDHKDNGMPPSKTRTRMHVTRMYSTTSSEDNGYLMLDVAWDPEHFKNFSDGGVKHQIISFIKGLESDKYYHDFGILGKPKLTFMDLDAGVATVKVRSSESRGVITMQYTGNDPQPLTGL